MESPVWIVGFTCIIRLFGSSCAGISGSNQIPVVRSLDDAYRTDGGVCPVPSAVVLRGIRKHNGTWLSFECSRNSSIAVCVFKPFVAWPGLEWGRTVE